MEEIKASTSPIETAEFGQLPDFGVAFRRLAIIDLSANGHQPMATADGKVWVVFNGEIYNYIEVRRELETLGHEFRTSSDTEVLLQAYVEWGPRCVQRFNGMWAFVIWDSRRRTLYCSRDRFGIKPFYYTYEPGKWFAFASELKSLVPLVSRYVDRSAVRDLLLLGRADHNERTFFEELKQLRGSQSLTVDPQKSPQITVKRYYDLPTTSERTPSKQDFDEFRRLLIDSVRLRLRADVPVGYALSGGLDSSSIVMAAHHIEANTQNHTFSTVYPGTEFDESPYISDVIEHTGFNQALLTPTASQLLDDMQSFVWHQEEPVPASAYYGEFALRRLITQTQIRVSLEGQGADEIVSGYRPLIAPYLTDLLCRGRLKAFRSARSGLSHLFPYSVQHIFGSYLAARAPRLNAVARARWARRHHPEWSSEFLRAAGQPHEKAAGERHYRSLLNQTLYRFLFTTSLPVQLTRADKSAMAFSLECRFPFLDHRLVEFAFDLSFHAKISGGRSKVLLREAMGDLLPRSVRARRDKVGFSTPQSLWMQTELRAFVDELTHDPAFQALPFLDWPRFRRVLEERGPAHLSIWPALAIHLWAQKFAVGWR